MKTPDVAVAIHRATEMFYEFQTRHRAGKEPTTLSFHALVERYIEEYPDKTKFQYDVKSSLRPFFGDVTDIETIDTAMCRKFWLWRWDLYKDWKPPGRSGPIAQGGVNNATPEPHQNTLKALRASLKGLLRFAHDNRWLSRMPNTDIPKKVWDLAPSENTRGTFDLPAYKKLIKELRWRCYYTEKREARPGNLKQQRVGIERMRFAVLLISNTCVRPSELNKLRHRDIELKLGTSPFEKANGVNYTLITITSKTSKTNVDRVIISHDYERTYGYYQRFLDIKNEYELPTGPDDLIFGSTRNPNKKANLPAYFRKLLDEWNLYLDEKKKGRVLYSLRSFAITMAINRGVPIHIVARNGGTSTRVIESAYWRAISWDLREVITQNRDLPRTPQGALDIAPLLTSDELEIDQEIETLKSELEDDK